ncbi:hypothetical protein GE061_012577 [Apolygus lucorum]|uniref:Uncharacterized protein n=1 Tax=Apolygus lucorum TaxID=248454 RepID=A0A6A4JVQ2_APOLU|nr:hypothetical protein GE061_012577 [Apolygus lucorum]
MLSHFGVVTLLCVISTVTHTEAAVKKSGLLRQKSKADSTLQELFYEALAKVGVSRNGVTFVRYDQRDRTNSTFFKVHFTDRVSNCRIWFTVTVFVGLKVKKYTCIPQPEKSISDEFV